MIARARARVRVSFGATAALLAVAIFLCGWELPLAASAKDAGAAPSPAAAPPAASAKAAAPGATPGTTPSSPDGKVKITFITVPPRNAMVFWGKKRLGVIAPHQPLVVQRPRDSGPMDVIVKSTGYLTVQTRAYTFADSKVAVKLTPPEEKNTLLGYREAPPEEAAAVPPAAAVNPGATPDAGTAAR